MEEVKEEDKDTIEQLLTEDPKDTKKRKKKEQKEAKRKAKKDKKAQKKNKEVVEEKEKPATEKKKSKKKIIIIASIIVAVLLLVLLAVLLLFPKIKLIGEKYVKVEYGEHYEDEGCTATYLGKDISDKIWYEGEVNEEKLGTYLIKCKVRKNRLTVSKSREVEIIDTKKPEIELVGESTTVICPNATYEEEGYKATDNYDGEITENVKIEEVEEGLSYIVSDSSGNKESVTRTIVKEDKTPPVITLKGNETTYVTLGKAYSESGYTSIDNCDNDLSEGVKVEGSVDTNNTGTYTLTYSSTDAAGNTGTKERKVIVQKAATKVGGNSGCGNAGTIYLTFDDGPHGSYTPYILNILKQYNVKATFFVLGSLVNSYPSIVQREVNEGHAVGIHTWSHDYATIYKSTDAFWSEVNRTHDAIQNATGYDSKLIRFPGGASNTVSRKYSTGIMSTLAREVVEKGYNYFDWNLSSGDAGGVKNATEEYNNVVKSLSKSRGNVILMHDIKLTTRDAIENIVKYGLDNGYTFDVLNTSIQCKQATNN